MSTDTLRHFVSLAELTDILARIFLRAGVSAQNAAILAANCARCERDGAHSHGVFRIPGYLASLNSGWVDGKAEPVLEPASEAFLRVDARNGFAQPALAAAAGAIADMVSRFGVAIVATRDSHHFSALWPDLEPFAADGLVSLSTVTGIATVIPPGGHRPVFGTNPMAFATPVEGGPPLIFDLATSSMSNGDLRIAAREGRTVPEGTGLDALGRPSTVPQDILDGGGLIPFGGHKGAAIALMVEILSSALTGGQFSAEVDFSSHPGAETPKTGQFLMVIDPDCGTRSRHRSRVATLVEMLRSAGQSRLPSDRRYANRALADRDGIPLTRQTYNDLLALADEEPLG